MITRELFRERLSDFYCCWRSSDERHLWGFSDIIVVSTPANAQPSWDLLSRNFFLWLLGEDVAGTTAVFTPSSIFFLCTQETFSGLHTLRCYAMNIRVSVELDDEGAAGVSKLDEIIMKSIRGLSWCWSLLTVRVGYVDWPMLIKSKILNDFKCFSEYRTVDVDPGVRKLIGIGEDTADASDYKYDILLATYMLLECNAREAMDKLGFNYNKQSSLIKEMKNIIDMSLGESAGTNEEEQEEEMKKFEKEAANQLRIKLLYSRWRKCRKELWGNSDVLVVTSAGSEEGSSMATHPVSCSFFSWLLGGDFPNTTAVFFDQTIHLICPIETCPQLCVLGLYMATAMVIPVSVEPRVKGDDESQVLNFSTLQHGASWRRGGAAIDPVIIGYIDGEAPNSKFVDTCGCVEYGRRFQATNVKSGFVKLLNEVMEGE